MRKVLRQVIIKISIISVLLFCLVIFVPFFIFSLASRDQVIASLPHYQSKNVYTEGIFQDFTDYGIYTFKELKVSELENSAFFEKLSEDSIENVLSYIDNFENWVSEYSSQADPSELAENYAFDKTLVDENDYVYIDTKEGEGEGAASYGRFDSYSVYFIDISTNTLYYFHSNI